MEVVPVSQEHVDELFTIYSRLVAQAPHSRFAGDRARFRDEVLGLETPSSTIFASPQSTQTFVALASGRARGFATLVSYRQYSGDGKDSKVVQAITGLFVDGEEAGSALIRTCEAQATTPELYAFPPTHGYTPMRTYDAAWDGLSDRVPQVARLLAKHGYTPYARELILIAPLVRERYSASFPPGITLEMQGWPDGRSEGRRLHPMDGEKEAGVCEIFTLAAISDDPAAKQVGYVFWLHVEEAYRRRGIGRALMAAAMDEMVAQGCTECWLTTGADNWNAQALYYSLGFDVVDCAVSFRKQLQK